MLTFLVIVQVVVALFLILVVLLQPGNKGGVGAALGGAGGDTVFGGRGANTFLAKLTLGAAVLFMLGSFTLSFLSSPQSSVVARTLQQEASAKQADIPQASKQAQPSEAKAPAAAAEPVAAQKAPETKTP